MLVMKKEFVILLVTSLLSAFLFSACSKFEPAAGSSELPALPPSPHFDSPSLPYDTNNEINDLEGLVPQAVIVQEMLKGKNILDGLGEIPFERVHEIIPEPNYYELGSRLCFHTKKNNFPAGDGGELPQIYNEFQNVNGDYEGFPFNIKERMYRAIFNSGFPFYSNLLKISHDGRRFIFDGANSGYYYMFNEDGFDYWIEKKGRNDDGAGIYPDDLSFCILFDKPSYLVNHTMSKKVELPNLQPADLNNFGYNGKRFAITRDNSNLIYILTNGEFVKYSLLTGTSKVIFADKPVESFEDYFILLDWKSSDEIYYQRNTKQYSLNINTGETAYVGEYMFGLSQSPDGKYIAYTHPDLWHTIGRLPYEEYLKYDEFFTEEDYGTIVEDVITGEIVKFIPGEYFVGWFYE